MYPTFSDASITDGATTLPTVGAVVPTHERPRLVRRAIASIVDQEYAGDVDVIVVYDKSEPDMSLEMERPGRRVRVVTNARTSGLAGARNTGILALSTDLVGFCDDDDYWLPGKLAAQVAVLRATPEVDFVTTAMRIDYGEGGKTLVRLAGRDEVTIKDLARSRMWPLGSPSFFFRRKAMIGPNGFGLVDETMPRSMGEDWDLLIRASRQHPIAHLDQPLVAIQWGGESYFNESWRDKNAAYSWMLERHPEIAADPVGAGLMNGKLAFGSAALGQRRVALSYVGRALRANWREPRGYIALLVVAGIPAGAIQKLLNKRGYGI